ncbi:MJ1255/VC2487 family glycosyltransferase [Methyloterricola oryzae]|uniref:MJ1255/VC2487 family glycosyltransferase n=1 Tax=Methyloterricola oryzae TaxID=1495050 RepID=UPI0005EAF48A|nr:MJ1255/VC2487 family glycosyltransferase [Methyloterricola oryzae]
MRIFFGVQATGNGHITRARALAPKLKQAGIEVDYLFSGRPWEQLFEMEVFDDYQWREGLTFSTRDGHIQHVRTAFRNNLLNFARDVRQLDLGGYDLVISDFEPVTAWAAKLQGVKHVLGIGHQYAFGYDIPKAAADFLGTQILRYFAPVKLGLGVHWHHFHHPILPPIFETGAERKPVDPRKIIVYLPFEDVDHVIGLLRRFHDHQFTIYSPAMPHDRHEPAEHIHVRQLSRAGFQADFADAAGVICNAGFELASESLHQGKKLLAKPLQGQMEQMSNALALELLQLGQVMQSLDSASIETWLEHSQAVEVRYPDVAQAVVDWICEGNFHIDQAWVDRIWAQAITRRD